MLLAIDTSTSAITVALADGPTVLARASELDARSHGERLAPLLQAVFDEVGAGPEAVSAVVVGEGPGPFTGLRVGLVSANVFAWARGLPSCGLCSLDALAWQAMGAGAADDPATRMTDGRLLVATDARRKEVYWATYDVTGDLPVRLAGPDVARAADLDERVRALPAVGRGPELYASELTGWPAQGPAIRDVDAGALAELAARRLARGEALEAPVPRYLRRPDARPQADTRSPATGRPQADARPQADTRRQMGTLA